MDLSIEGISKRKALLLIIICFCIFFLGTVGLGGISIRIMVLMLLLIYGIGNIPKYTDNTIFNWYIIYLITLLFFSFINQDMQADYFWRNFLSYHFLAIATYVGFSSLIRRRSELLFLIYILMAIMSINAIVTILQFFNNPIGWAIGVLFGSDLDSVSLYLDSHKMDNFNNVALCSGINGNGVVNGYTIATFFPIISILLWCRNKVPRIVGVLIIMVNLIAVYCVQQRMALLCVLVTFAIILYNKVVVQSDKLLISCLVLLSVILVCSDLSFSSFDLGRFSPDTDNSNRLALFEQMQRYLDSDDSFIGGYDKYCSQYAEQHNTFLDVITRVGVLGFPIFLVYFCITVKKLAKSFSLKHIDLECLLSLSGIIFILYSQTHSSGIQSGISYYWLIISMLYSSKRITS